MPIPLRMNLMPVSIKQFSVASTPLDADFGAPNVGQKKVYGGILALKAQVAYVTKDRQENAMTGDPGIGDGHLCFRKSDLDRQSIMLQKGDIITSIAGFDVNYKIIEVRPSGHLRKRANLIMAYFETNSEVRPNFRR